MHGAQLETVRAHPTGAPSVQAAAQPQRAPDSAPVPCERHTQMVRQDAPWQSAQSFPSIQQATFADP